MQNDFSLFLMKPKEFDRKLADAGTNFEFDKPNSMNFDNKLTPFEICGIRPPTENQSLTFRLTRNCYWNKCSFCPVYKQGARFSRRSISDIKRDIDTARLLNDALDELSAGSESDIFSSNRTAEEYRRAQALIHRIRQAQGMETGVEKDFESKNGNAEESDVPLAAWFRQWFKDAPTTEDSINHLAAWRIGDRRTCFLGDADSLILKPEFIEEVIDHIKAVFPSLHRFTVYGRTISARRKAPAELRKFRQAGLNRVHFGVESGSDLVLKNICKGETKADHIEGCLKTREAGLSCSIYVMPGLGGDQHSDEHASETTEVITRAAPNFVRLRTLQIFPHTPLARQQDCGAFSEASESQVVAEIRRMIAEIDTPTQIISDSATNLLQINGRLPEDRRYMLNLMDDFLALTPLQKKQFSLQARMEAFESQYGGFTKNIYAELKPFIQDGSLDISTIPEAIIDKLVFLIRARLMP